MTAILYLSPDTDTAFQYAATQIHTLRQTKPLLPVVVLASTAQTIHSLRKQVGDSMGIHFYSFYDLAKAILDAAGIPVHWLADTAIRFLLRHLLAEMVAAGELTSFLAVWRKPGFIQVLLEWLREVKTQGILPEDVSQDAHRSRLERDRQLARLYERYQRFLQQHSLSDADGLLWLAAEALEHDPSLFSHAGLVLCLGFDQFNPLQERILQALARRNPNFNMTLLWDTHRLEGSLALSRLAETRRQLVKQLPHIHEQVLPAQAQVAPPLQLLRQRLFDYQPSAITVDSADTAEKPVLRAWQAPSRQVEVRLALREIKQLLLQGIPPDEITLLAPKMETYQRLVELTAEEYGIPLQVELPLESSPALRALLALLSLPPHFPWRATLDCLRSPFIRQPWLSPRQICQLELLSRQRPVLQGREQWLFALQPWEKMAHSQPSSNLAGADDEEEDINPSALVPDELSAIRDGLLAFFDLLSPPAAATYHQYALWLQENLLGLFSSPQDELEQPAASRTTLDLIACCQEGESAALDLRALHQALRQLGALVNAAQLVLDKGETPGAWADFYTAYLECLASVRLPPDPLQSAVRFGRLEAGREKPCDHLFVLGLSEGEFPKLPPADPLYTPAERQQHPLPLRRLRQADDATLWWLVLSNCRRTLTLLRPYLDENGAPWEASPYWDAALAQVPFNKQEFPIAYAPNPQQAASPAELLVALVQAHSQGAPPELQEAWQAAHHAHQVMTLRQSWQPAPLFEGCFQSGKLQAELYSRYPPDAAWSASRLNRYGICPFSFFAQCVLELAELADPQEGYNPMQRGSLQHTILEHLLRWMTKEGVSMSPENQPLILQHLEGICQQEFSRAPLRLGFRPTPLWGYEQAELHRQLSALVAWECQQQSPYLPYQQELRFGIPGGQLPRSRLADSAGGGFFFHGVIDRLDRQRDNHTLRVLDYKSSRTEFNDRDIIAGRALQTALYAAAVETLLGEIVTESAYLLIPRRMFSAHIKAGNGMLHEDIVQQAIDQASGFILHIQQGDFPALPSDPNSLTRTCTTYCPYYDLCRVNRQAIAKARRGGS